MVRDKKKTNLRDAACDATLHVTQGHVAERQHTKTRARESEPISAVSGTKTFVGVRGDRRQKRTRQIPVPIATTRPLLSHVL